jgi:predicted 2-oxoglutarate/Fe(II)-dependent dioxygenase YbiX
MAVLEMAVLEMAGKMYTINSTHTRIAEAFKNTLPKKLDLKNPVLVVENALSDTCCSKTYHAVSESMASGNMGARGTVYTQDGLGSKVAENYRRVNIHSINLLNDTSSTLDRLNNLIQELSYNNWGFENITPCAQWWLAGYGVGDKFEEHCDGAIATPGGNYKTVDSRLVSAIAYFNTKDSMAGSGFTGGSLVFPGILDDYGVPLTISPKQGDLVLFPSTWQFSHKVTPIRSGYRLTATNFFKSGVPN